MIFFSALAYRGLRASRIHSKREFNKLLKIEGETAGIRSTYANIASAHRSAKSGA